MRRRAAILGTVLLAAALPASAGAAFPGADGAIVFTSASDGDDDLYAIAPDGTGLRPLTATPGREQQPAVSPDGRSIAFKTVVSGPRDEESWVAAFDGSGARQVTTTPGDLRFSTQPAWSADGQRLLVRSNRDEGHYDVWSVRVSDGGDPRQLTDDTADDRYPVPSPDGTLIAFRSDRAGDPDVWVMDADGANPRNLTAGSGRWESAPSWSPDGTRLAFERAELPGNPEDDPAVEASGEIWTMAVDGSDQRRLTTNGAKEEGPAWSPEGTRIAFTTERDDPDGDIWVMGADGSDQRPVFATPALEESPDWQPLPRGGLGTPSGGASGGGASGGTPGGVPRTADTDRDGLPDRLEDRDGDGRLDRGETDPRRKDTDRDRIWDGREDRDRDGRRDRRESDPRKRDTDRDGLWDAREDRDRDGRRDRGENDPTRRDTDRDGIRDARDKRSSIR
ncbi:PD40 domain-containing protein [Conexibacter sp. SYSU D00693]|uniref:PD40 domain-containing protein n=1 Tax=Conexibacter sp. SYSU D00693 TaxID=2812560 RepID=UPI00196ABAB8|nr:PD40 domain-containing protein [Conexibacter sp. SYSU D00693]